MHAQRPTQQSPLLQKNKDYRAETSQKSGQVQQMQEATQGHVHHPSTAYTVVIDLINLILASTEIGLVLYLSIDHFTHGMGVIAVIMLAPILLNFVGVTYFFSDERERAQFEQVGTTRLTKDMFQIPVFGPVFTALKVLLISSGLTRNNAVEYERFEASAVKMRQCQTFFSAAPEAMVQLSLLYVSRQQLEIPNYLEIAVVLVSILTLSEANVYAMRSNYFRLFKTYSDGDWQVHETFGKKCVLFLHSFCSIATRVTAGACLMSGVQCIALDHVTRRRETAMAMMTAHASSGTSSNRASNPGQPGMHMGNTEMTEMLGYIIGLSFIALIVYHMIVYYIARVLRYKLAGKDAPGGCYESINYGWRSTILHFGFQSKNLATQIWFYVENCAMFVLWWFALEYSRDEQWKQRTQLPMTIIFTTFTILSVFFLFAAVGMRLHSLHSPFKFGPRYSKH